MANSQRQVLSTVAVLDGIGIASRHNAEEGTSIEISIMLVKQKQTDNDTSGKDSLSESIVLIGACLEFAFRVQL